MMSVPIAFRSWLAWPPRMGRNILRGGVVWLLWMLIPAKGMTAEMMPTPELHPCELVYVVNHGLHTGIVVKREDLLAVVPGLSSDWTVGNYIEVGWGDAKYYQARKTSIILAIRAMFWPTDSVLHVVSIPETPHRFFWGDVTIVALTLPRVGYQRLLGFIAESFDYAEGRRMVSLGPGLYGNSRFYRARGSFHAFNTCNTWVARSLEVSGYPIRSRGIVSATGLLSRLRTFDPTMHCLPDY